MATDTRSSTGTFDNRDGWSTKWGVILAVTGSAVGLGNFLRFPGLAATHGGAFMIPYMVAFLFVGLPLAWAEWALGRYGGEKGYSSPPGIYRAVWSHRAAPYVGTLAVLTPMIIYMFYVYVEAWCLAYAMRYLFNMMDLGNNPDAYKAFFGSFVGMGENGAAELFSGNEILTSAPLFLVISFVINFVLIYRGVSKGIEWFCQWAMPALIVCALAVLVRVLTLGSPMPDMPDRNIIEGLGYMWNPVAENKTWIGTLSNPQVWLDSAAQIFFSLSVGYGIIITYSSYLRKEDDIALSSMTAAAGNGFCEVALGGMITIPAAFIFLGPAYVQENTGTFTLGFQALPCVFQQMPAGNIFGFLFFFLLFLAAVTSSLSMLQPAIAFLEEGTGMKRKGSVAVLGFVTAVGAAFVVYFSKDLLALDTLDFWFGNVAIYILGMIHAVLFAWVLGLKRGMEELREGAEISIPSFFAPIIAFVTPTYLIIVFSFWFYGACFPKEGETSRIHQLLQEPTARNSMLMALLVAAFLLLLAMTAARRWRYLEGKAARETDNGETTDLAS